MIWERTRHNSTTICSHPSSLHNIFCHAHYILSIATRTHLALLDDSLNLSWHTTGSLASLAKLLPFNSSAKYISLAPLYLIQAHMVNITLVKFRKTFGFKVDANSCLLGHAYAVMWYDELIKVLKPGYADVPLWSFLPLFFDFAPLLCDWLYSSVFHACTCSYYLFLQQL